MDDDATAAGDATASLFGSAEPGSATEPEDSGNGVSETSEIGSCTTTGTDPLTDPDQSNPLQNVEAVEGSEAITHMLAYR